MAISHTAQVLVTRPKGRGTALRQLLRQAGAQVTEVPLIGFEPTGERVPPLRRGDILVVTSATVVPFLEAQPEGVEVAAVGPRTAHALESAGIRVSVTPRRALSSALVSALGSLEGRRVVYPRAEVVPRTFEASLRQSGARVQSVAVYRTVLPAGTSLKGIWADVVTLASGSAARHYAQLGGIEGSRVAAIGPSTAQVCADLGIEVHAVAAEHTSEGLAAAALSLIG
jgi:uroporphyrinogen-III synthase